MADGVFYVKLIFMAFDAAKNRLCVLPFGTDQLDNCGDPEASSPSALSTIGANN